jgi:hypothetical protein
MMLAVTAASAEMSDDMAPMLDEATLVKTGGVVPEDYSFAILRKGRKIGEHHIRFSPTADGLKVDIDIDIKVKVGPITVYSYTHDNTELWRNGQLVSIETVTDANGKDYAVSGRASAEGFVVSGKNGEITLPADIMPTSYWQADFMDSRQLLDTQRGNEMNVAITAQAYDDAVAAQEYMVEGDLELNLWYGDARLRKLTFDNDGALIEYKPIEGQS